MALLRNNSKEPRRFFPKVGKCFCCFCLSESNSVIFCTLIFLIFYLCSTIYTFISQGVKFLFSIGNYLTILSIISLALLLLGLQTYNVYCLDQFKIIFTINVFYRCILYIYLIVTSSVTLYHSSSSDTIKSYKSQYEVKGYSINSSDSTISKTIRIKSIISILECIIGIFIHVYYFLTTGSYIQDVEETLMVGQKLKDNENGEETEYE